MPEDVQGEYRRVRLHSPASFQPGSFVTITSGSHRIIAGVLKGERQVADEGPNKGKKRLTPQAILHPVKEGHPCPECEVARLNRRR